MKYAPIPLLLIGGFMLVLSDSAYQIGCSLMVMLAACFLERQQEDKQ